MEMIEFLTTHFSQKVNIHFISWIQSCLLCTYPYHCSKLFTNLTCVFIITILLGKYYYHFTYKETETSRWQVDLPAIITYSKWQNPLILLHTTLSLSCGSLLWHHEYFLQGPDHFPLSLFHIPYILFFRLRNHIHSIKLFCHIASTILAYTILTD